jgi:hypothetical protein
MRCFRGTPVFCAGPASDRLRHAHARAGASARQDVSAPTREGKKPQDGAWGNLRSRFPQNPPTNSVEEPRITTPLTSVSGSDILRSLGRTPTPAFTFTACLCASLRLATLSSLQIPGVTHSIYA